MKPTYFEFVRALFWGVYGLGTLICAGWLIATIVKGPIDNFHWWQALFMLGVVQAFGLIGWRIIQKVRRRWED